MTNVINAQSVSLATLASQLASIINSNALTATALSTAVVTAPTTAGVTVDTTDQSVVLTTAQLARQTVGNALPAVKLENNASMVPSTVGKFWTQADATANGGTVDHPALVTAAINWSGTNQRAVIFPPITVNTGSTTFNVTAANVHLIGHEHTRWIVAGTGSSWKLFAQTGNNFRLDRFIFGPADGIYTHWRTGLLLNAPGPSDTWTVNTGVLAAGTPTKPAFSDYWTVTSGVLPSGANVHGTWLTSSTQLFLTKTNTMYFDGLPVGLTLSALNALVAAGNLPVHSNQYLNYGSYIAQGTVVALSTIGSWTGYAVNITPASGFTTAIGASSIGALAAVPSTSETSSAPASAGRPAMAGPSILLLSSAPYFSPGGIITTAYGTSGIFLNFCEFRNITAGRAILAAGDRPRFNHVNGWGTDGNGGSAIIRVNAGSDGIWNGGTLYSGDQAIQVVPGCSYSNGAFASSSNLPVVGMLYTGVNACSLSAQVVSFGLTVQNSNQQVNWVVPSGCSVGNSLTIPGPIPAGLTLAQLQASTQAANIIYLTINNKYSVGGACVTGIVDNGNGTYTLTLTPPIGTTNSIKLATTSSVTAHLTTGVPLGAMTASIIGCRVTNCNLIVANNVGVNFQNADSQGVIDAEVSHCTIDSTWAANTDATLYAVVISGGTYGGVRPRIRFNHFIASAYGHFSTNGIILDPIFEGNTFGSVQNPTKSPFLIAGVTGGALRANTIWCPPGVTTITVGGNANYQDQLGQIAPGDTSNFNIDGNTFRGGQDGQVTVSLTAGSNRRVRNNLAYQASALGSGSPNFVTQKNTITVVGPDYVDGNDLTQWDGTDYIEANIGIIYGGAADINNSAPAVSGAVRTVRLSPKQVANAPGINTASLSTTLPATSGVLWNNGGVLSIS